MSLGGNSVETLKTRGYYYAAGALAKQMGFNRRYGCHMGMQSTRDEAMFQFYQGYDAAPKRNKER